MFRIFPLISYDENKLLTAANFVSISPSQRKCISRKAEFILKYFNSINFRVNNIEI